MKINLLGIRATISYGGCFFAVPVKPIFNFKSEKINVKTTGNICCLINKPK